MLDDIIDFFTASLVGLFGWFFGGRDGFVNVLITFVIIDYIMGVMVAYSRHELSSSIGYNGIARKMAIFCLIGVAHVIDVHVLGDATALRTPVTLFYAANEGISIIENADALGLPIPQFLKARLLNLKELATDHDNHDKQAMQQKTTATTETLPTLPTVLKVPTMPEVIAEETIHAKSKNARKRKTS